MNNRKRLNITLACLAIAGFASSVFAVTDADIDTSFFPYKKGMPSVQGLQPGSVINKVNVGKFKEVLDAATVKFIENGWHEIEVGPTHSVPLHPNYVALTKKNAGQAKLGAKVGTIENFKGGRPFPYDPDPKDPRAGEKLAFNFKYSQIVGDAGRIFPFYWEYKDMSTGKIERTISFDFHFLNYKYRSVQAPIPDIMPNPSDLYRGIYLKVLEPQDLKNTQLLIQRFDDDAKLDDSYLYLGFQRRVRRLATGQTTDSFLGSDLMIQDFEGFNARVQDMNWMYKGTEVVLLPFYNHSELKQTDPKFEDGYGMTTFGGKSTCFPNIPWSLRKAYVLETTPTDPTSPVGRRVMYLDAQTMQFPVILIYDRKGELWKRWVVGFSDADKHAPANKGAGIAIYTSAAMVDVQASHCTTLKLRMISEASSNPPNLFTVQNLRGGD
jgi:hypothetical protein